MAPLPTPKTPSDQYAHDIAVSLRLLAGRDEDGEGDGTVSLREPAQVEGVDATPTPATSAGTQSAPSGDESGSAGDETPSDGPFEPSDHTVDEVNSYLARDDVDEAERQRVIDAEKAGKDRKTVQAPANE